MPVGFKELYLFDNIKQESYNNFRNRLIIKINRLRMKKAFKFSAFTLAEVLITLGIIGVVAAMTIPVLMNNVTDAQYKTAYKKAYSVASQALISATQQDLLVSIPNVGSDPNHEANFLAFMSQFKVTKQCINNDGGECWNPSGEPCFLSYPDSTAFSFIDSSGMAWSEYANWARTVLVDTNGNKKPNQWGKDRFAFALANSAYDSNQAFNVNDPNLILGIPVKIVPFPDNYTLVVCVAGNKCSTENNYYGTSWLFN